jgi:hypothetical protein
VGAVRIMSLVFALMLVWMAINLAFLAGCVYATSSMQENEAPPIR